MPKKQKVRFHKGDKRPNNGVGKLKYITNMIKKGKKILWQVHEDPTDKVVAEFFFEEDAQKLCDFQNEYQVWSDNGGIPSFLYKK